MADADLLPSNFPREQPKKKIIKLCKETECCGYQQVQPRGYGHSLTRPRGAYIKEYIMKSIIGCVVLAVVFMAAVSVEASGFGEAPIDKPSVFQYGMYGLGTGTLAGSSAGYLIVRSGGFSNQWRLFLLSTGIGALSGAGFGLLTGMLDLGEDRPGIGSVILRDTLYGTLFGGGIGLISGGLAVLSTDNWEHMALGMCIGALSGVGVGILFGILEGSLIHRRSKRERDRLKIGVTVTETAQNRTLMMPAVIGTF